MIFPLTLILIKLRWYTKDMKLLVILKSKIEITNYL